MEPAVISRTLALILVLIAAGAILLSGCTPRRPELQTRVQTVEVDRPIHAPCPARSDVPAVPRRVAEDHPTMPRVPDGSPDWQAVSRILGAKVIELFGYIAQADAIMRACSAPGTGSSQPLQPR